MYITKKIKVPETDFRDTVRRVSKICSVRPLGLCIYEDVQLHPEASSIDLIYKYVNGMSLAQYFKLRAFPAYALVLNNQLNDFLSDWKSIGFIHGDLSCANIIISECKQNLTVIDPLIPLTDKTGTKEYFHPLLYWGKSKGFCTDKYAMQKVQNRLVFLPRKLK